MQSCSHKECDQINPQPLDAFYERYRGRTSWCKACFRKNANECNKTKRVENNEYSKKWHKNNKEKVRNRKLLSLYGITPERYQELLILQSYKCAICNKNQDDLSKPLSVDHCHKTNKIRGLLCYHCNVAIGLFFDNPEFCNNASKYLKTD